MFEKMNWDDVYELWKRNIYTFPAVLTEPVSVETVFVEYNREGYIYGYDWLEANEARERKQLIARNPVHFLLFTEPTNKGTIKTAEMLFEARDEEELAAVWIAATAKELSEYRFNSDLWRYTNALYTAACEFLQSRYYLWHHAMKRLVPEIMIPLSVLENIVCEDAAPVVGLIQMNTVLLKSTWNILRYSSLKDGEVREDGCRIRRE